MDFCEALRRFGDTRQNFKERSLASAVPPDDADNLSVFDIKGRLLKSPDEGVRLFRTFRWPLTSQIRMHASERSAQDSSQGLTEGLGTQARPDAVALTKIFNANGNITHTSHRVRERLFHSAEIVQTGDQQRESRQRRSHQ